ncbi:MAG TPA: hypothetical protein VII81_13785, partial [Terriglobales bacterium]
WMNDSAVAREGSPGAAVLPAGFAVSAGFRAAPDFVGAVPDGAGFFAAGLVAWPTASAANKRTPIANFVFIPVFLDRESIVIAPK